MGKKILQSKTIITIDKINCNENVDNIEKHYSKTMSSMEEKTHRTSSKDRKRKATTKEKKRKSTDTDICLSSSCSDRENISKLSFKTSKASKSMCNTKRSNKYIKKSEKQKRGRKPAVSIEVIKEKLKDVALFDENGVLKKEVDKIWDEACLKLDNKVRKHNLYLKIFDNDDNIQTDLRGNKDNDIKTVHEESPSKQISQIETIEALEGVCCDVYYKPMFKELCEQPLHVFYWWPDQRSLYQEFYKKIDFPIILSSSTQIHPQIVNNEEMHIITAFAVHSEINGEPISFCQSLTTRTDEEHLHYILSEWLREKIPAPTHVICTFAMLEAAMLAFNFMTVVEYSLKCYQFLTNPKSLPPHSIIQVDSIPFLKDVEKMIDDCFIGEQFAEVRKFHLDSMIYLATMIHFHEFETVIKKVFSILRSSFLNDSVRTFITDLRKTCSVGIVQEWKLKLENYCVEKVDNHKIHDFSSLKKCTSDDLTKYLNDKYKEAKVDCSSSGNELNAYKSIKYLNFFMNLLKYFPVWTGICIYTNHNLSIEYHDLMQKYWNSVHESFMKPRKNLPKAEEFILQHGDFLTTQMQQCRQVLDGNKKIIRTEKDIKNSIDFHTCLQPKENWMNKVEADATIQYQNESLMKTDYVSESINEETFSKTIHDLSGIPQESSIDCDETKFVTKNNNMKNKVLDESAIECNNISAYSSESARIEYEHKYTAEESQTNAKISDIPKNDKRDFIMHSTPKNHITRVGKYTTAFPAIQAYHNKPSQKNVTKKLLQNKKPNKVKKIQYYIQDSSAFDSVAEVIIQAINNFHQFKTYCIEATQMIAVLDFLKSSLEYADTGNLSNLYKDRVLFLREIGVINRDTICLNDKLNTYFCKLMKNHPSLVKQKNCNCGYSDKSYDFLVDIIPDPIIVENCCICGQALVVSVQVGNYIAFNYETRVEDFDIYSIKDSIDINGKTYLLAGVIGHTKSNAKNDFVHYTAYCRPIVGAWTIKDTFNKKKEYLKKNKSRVKVAIVFYVQQDL